MPRQSLPVSPTASELELLRLLWRIGPADARRVHQALAEERPDATYAAVLRHLQLMHAKGLLRRDESQRPQLYAPAVAQDKLQKGLLKDVISKMFAGSGKALVMAALKSHVTAAERAEIARLLRDEEGSDPQ